MGVGVVEMAASYPDPTPSYFQGVGPGYEAFEMVDKMSWCIDNHGLYCHSQSNPGLGRICFCSLGTPLLWTPCSLIPSLYSPAFFFTMCEKKSWGVETGNEARDPLGT